MIWGYDYSARLIVDIVILSIHLHTTMNKVTGGLLFLFPFGIGRGLWQVSAIVIIVIGVVATFAAIQEGHYIRKGRAVE